MPGDAAFPARTGEVTPRFIKAEANLLRLPLFSLHTKGLRSIDGIECRGRLNRDGSAHEFIFRATRNTATLYPGPLARSAHLAFLSLATERGFPLANPISWSWRDLCRRMGISCSGRTVERLKEAIRSTKGLMISSQYAIYSKESGRLIRTERDLNLYDEIAFVSESLPGGGVADTNYLWFSDWYLSNLNAFFTAPLDYDLWRQLDDRSPIASRLYEFLLINFHSGVPLLRINYDNLAQFLPVRPEKYLSDARRQFEAAFQVLTECKVVDSAEWSTAKNGDPQLIFRRGALLVPPRDRGQLPFEFMEEEEFADSVKVAELRNQRPPEWGLVVDFYKLWAGREDHRPTKKELAQARELVERHGVTKARGIVQLAVKKAKARWPEAKAFGGAMRYLDDAAAEYEADQKRLDRERGEQARRRTEREQQARQDAEQRAFEAKWRPAWERLDPGRKEAIRRGVLDDHPFAASLPAAFLESLCLEALSRGNDH